MRPPSPNGRSPPGVNNQRVSSQSTPHGFHRCFRAKSTWTENRGVAVELVMVLDDRERRLLLSKVCPIIYRLQIYVISPDDCRFHDHETRRDTSEICSKIPLLRGFRPLFFHILHVVVFWNPIIIPPHPFYSFTIAKKHFAFYVETSDWSRTNPFTSSFKRVRWNIRVYSLTPFMALPHCSS